MVHVEVEDRFAALVDDAWLRRAAQAALEAERRTAANLTLVITDDNALRELNQSYRGIDTPTDVLAFGGETPGFVQAPDAGDYLGDVIISYPRAKTQAAGHTVPDELALLVVHGVLHLLGYDHNTPENQARMWQLQAVILERLGLAAIQPKPGTDG
jgi:probable rRNA maturation factor